MNLWESSKGRRRFKSARVLVASLVALTVLLPGTVWASHTFTDVPDSNTFHDDISWLAGTGITSGCTATTYCPGTAVTRAQMARFLKNNYKVHAGLTAVDYATDGNGTADIDTETTVTGLSAAVAIPPGTKGRIVATFSGDVQCNSGDNIWVLFFVIRPQCKARLLINGVEMAPGWHVLANSLDAASDGDLAIDQVGFSFQAVSAANLSPGTYTVTAQMMADDVDTNEDDTLVMDIGRHTLRVDAVLADPA